MVRCDGKLWMVMFLTDQKGSTYIEFDAVEVPVQNLLGEENMGFWIVMSSIFFKRRTCSREGADQK